MTERPNLVRRVVASRRLLPILLLVSTFFAFGAWALATPPGGSADEDFHLASVWCANDARGDLCEPGSAPNTRELPGSLVDIKECFVFDSSRSAACQDLSDTTPDTETKRGNFAGGYPPVYYAVMNVFAGIDIALSAVIMRLVSVVIFLGMLSALWLLLPVARRGALVLTWLVSSVPMGAALIASNNPSGWAMIGVGTLWLAVLGYLEAPTRGRTIGLFAVAAVATLLAAGSRGDAALYAIIAIGVGSVLAIRRNRVVLLRLLPLLALVLIAVLCVISARQVVSGVSGFNGWKTDSGQVLEPVDPVAQLFPNLMNLPSLWNGAISGAWGLGWQDVPLPALAQFLVLVAFIGVAFLGLRHTRWRKALMLVGLVSVLIVVPLYVLFQSKTWVGQAVQPRYLLPIVVMLLGVALVSERADRAIRLSLAQAIVVGVGLVVAYALDLHVTLRRFTTGIDVGGVNLNAHLEWWWDTAPSPMVVFAVGTLAFAVSAAIALVLVRRESGRSLARDISTEPVAV